MPCRCRVSALFRRVGVHHCWAPSPVLPHESQVGPTYGWILRALESLEAVFNRSFFFKASTCQLKRVPRTAAAGLFSGHSTSALQFTAVALSSWLFFADVQSGNVRCRLVYRSAIVDTIVEHNRETQSWNTIVEHNHGTQSWNTTVEHNRETQSWNTIVEHNRGTQSWNTIVEHNRGTQSWNTIVEHNQETPQKGRVAVRLAAACRRLPQL